MSSYIYRLKMITEEQYLQIRAELLKIKELPFGWGGRKQNNSDDDKINLFNIFSFNDLINKTSEFDKQTRDYYIKRWFIIRISDCDEFLFNQLPETRKNPNKYSKRFDFIIKGFEFDIKGTRVPFKFKDNIKNVYENPKQIIEFYYQEQSTGRRFGLQNRLFIVTIDEDKYFDEIFLRRDFNIKKKAFIEYIQKLRQDWKFYEININGKIYLSDIIFIIKKNNVLKFSFASDNLN
jgi:hypothetical protein